MYGSCSQFDLSGKYNGNQCTSMSAAAGVLWLLKASNTLVEVTNEMVNDIVLNGHTLHTRLRYQFTHIICHELDLDLRYLITSLPSARAHFIFFYSFCQSCNILHYLFFSLLQPFIFLRVFHTETFVFSFILSSLFPFLFFMLSPFLPPPSFCLSFTFPLLSFLFFSLPPFPSP